MREKEVLSVGERETLQQEKKELENALRDVESGEYGKGTKGEMVDKSALNRQINRLDKAIHKGTPRLRSKDKDKISNEAKALEEKFTQGMPTRDEMVNPEKHPGCVRKNYEWSKKNAQDIRRWKHLRRMLEPKDPTVSSIERLRRR